MVQETILGGSGAIARAEYADAASHRQPNNDKIVPGCRYTVSAVLIPPFPDVADRRVC